MLMKGCRVLLIGIVCSMAFAVASLAQSPASAPQNSWNALVDDYIDQAVFALNPTGATAAGVHQHDAELEDLSHAGIEKQVAILREFEKRSLAIDAKGVSPLESADQEMLLNAIRGSLLPLEVIRPWEKNPDTYLSG